MLNGNATRKVTMNDKNGRNKQDANLKYHKKTNRFDPGTGTEPKRTSS